MEALGRRAFCVISAALAAEPVDSISKTLASEKRVWTYRWERILKIRSLKARRIGLVHFARPLVNE